MSSPSSPRAIASQASWMRCSFAKSQSAPSNKRSVDDAVMARLSLGFGDAGTARETPEKSRCGSPPCASRAARLRSVSADTASTRRNPASRKRCHWLRRLRVEVGEANGSALEMPDSYLWTLYQRLRSEGAPLSMRKVANRSEIFPVFHELFQSRRSQEKVAP